MVSVAWTFNSSILTFSFFQVFRTIFRFHELKVSSFCRHKKRLGSTTSHEHRRRKRLDNSFDLVAFTALPYLTVNARAAPPAFPCKYLITVSANYLRCKWIAFRPMGIGVCPMLLQILFPAFYFKLYTFPYPL